MLIIQLPASEGCRSNGEKKTEDKKTINGFSGKLSINGELHRAKRPSRESRLKNGAVLQPTTLLPIKTTNSTTKSFSSESPVEVKGRTVSSDSNTGPPSMEPRLKFIVKRSVTPVPKSGGWMRNTAYRGRRAVRRNRRLMNVRTTRRVRGTRRRIQSGRRTATAKPTFILSTSKTNGKRSNATILPTHPCNSKVKSSVIRYKVKDVECRRWRTSELEQRLNCLGKFNHQYLAASWREALKFRDLDTGGTLNFSKSFIWKRISYSSRHRIKKRDVHINPGETMIVQCYAAKTPTETGHLRMCPICTAITRQPSQPRRFPEYINELVCDPKSKSNYIAGIDGFCVQKTFTVDLLQFDGDWEKDSALSAQAGHDVYIEKWEPYTQTIKRHCACELLPSSPIMSLL